ncbi:MAG TPA: peptide chain release factor 1 [bacterium]|nr:peptide chain release factor 1 [bacterium]
MKFELDSLLDEYARYENDLADPAVYSDTSRLKDLMKKKKRLERVVTLYREYKTANKDLTESKSIIETESDPEMLELAREEMHALLPRIEQLEEDIKIALLPKDENDDKNIILEVRAGAGGEEAALFARELFDAYVIFAKASGFSVETLDESESESGGYKEVVAKISGDGAYSRFKYESGTHRVQRVPETESKGRVHTSTITVAILPEVEDVEVEIREEDLEITVARASGAGGQHVNKTNSAVRMVHLPSGVVVECQDGRSQIQNKQKALMILKSRVYALELAKQQAEIGANRLAQVGTGDRSEKIRTYNFPQDRITDHRIGANFSNIPVRMAGDLADIVESLAVADQTEKLQRAAEGSVS